MTDARKEYGDIIDREHPDPEKHPRMPRRNRAAQFAPFAALTGYDDLIRESERETDAPPVLDENELEELNDKLTFLLQSEDRPEAEFTVFVPDGKKPGGKYAAVRGRVLRFDEFARSLTLDSGVVIRCDTIVQIKCEALSRYRDL